MHLIKLLMTKYVAEAIGDMVTTAGPFPANATSGRDDLLSTVSTLTAFNNIVCFLFYIFY